MNENAIATLFSTPLGQIAVTAVVAAIVAAIVVRIMQGQREQPKQPAWAPVPDARRDTAGAHGAIVAAISAAVYAAVGPHRIIYVSAARPSSGWTTEVRTQHHTSHAPHAPHSNPTHR